MTNPTRLVHLRDNVGYINALEIPEDVGCNLLCLSDRQAWILRSMTFPYAFWETRIVRPGGGDAYWTDPLMLEELQETLEDLELQLSGGGVMGCESIAAGLVALAEAIEAQTAAGGAGCTTNVYCGGTSLNALGTALGNMPTEDIIGNPPAAAPEYGTPPEGFETWEAYQVYKCQAAWYVWTTLRNFSTSMLMMAGLNLTAAIATPIILGSGIVVAGAVTALSFTTILGGVLLLFGASALAFTAFDQIGDYLEAHKAEIICQLYNSGSSTEAVDVVIAVMENAVQAIVWASLLSGLEVMCAPIITDILAAAATPDLVRPLFVNLIEMVFEDADCSGCYSANLLLNGHFLDGLDNWNVPGGNVSVLDSTRIRFDSNEANGINYINQEVTLTETRTYSVGLKGNQGPAPHLVVIEMVIDLDEVLTLPTGDDEVHEVFGAVYLSAGVHTVYVGVQQMGAYPAYDGAIDYVNLL